MPDPTEPTLDADRLRELLAKATPGFDPERLRELMAAKIATEAEYRRLYGMRGWDYDTALAMESFYAARKAYESAAIAHAHSLLDTLARQERVVEAARDYRAAAARLLALPTGGVDWNLADEYIEARCSLDVALADLEGEADGTN